MRIIAIATVAALTFVAAPAVADAPTDISSQVRIDAGPGGVGVGVGHGRYESSRRRDRVIVRERRHDRFESRGARRDCRTVTIRERLPGGGTRTVKRREC